MQTKNKKPGLIVFMVLAILVIFSNSCKKDTDVSSLETGTLTDIDGNIYKTVKIGGTWWMAENLKVKRYSSGDSIKYINSTAPDSAWSKLVTGAYCYFDWKYGYLYNFFTIADSRGIAPAGWHIPTDQEWQEMELFLGMNKDDAEKMNWRGEDQGNRLKITGGNTVDWAKSDDEYSIFGTNESGFAAVGGACRMFNGEWGEITHTTFWWTSSMSENNAWYRGLDYNKKNVFRYYGLRNYGFSIRCVKD
ncbi:MAG: fibrobacter succinogenes major paralogous domain-containing protein [Bacteroidota bacterium]